MFAWRRWFAVLCALCVSAVISLGAWGSKISVQSFIYRFDKKFISAIAILGFDPRARVKILYGVLKRGHAPVMRNAFHFKEAHGNRTS
jgi:hypothetical protein